MADFGGDLCHQSVHGVLIGDVADVAVGVDASLFVSGKTLVHKLLLDVVEHDGRAIGCHCLGDGHADAVGCAGDQRDLAGQIKGFGSTSCHRNTFLQNIFQGGEPFQLVRYQYNTSAAAAP